MENKKYTILEKDRYNYVGLVLLNEIINFQHYIPVKANGDDVFLSDYLKNMQAKGALAVKDGKYIPTAKGREELVNLYAKYYEYLKMFDIFCAVDLEKGEFAFSRMLDDISEEDWKNHISDNRFSDVRVAVADFKGLNPTEIVFMSFLNENKFDCTAPRWQYILTGESVWKEVEEICNTAITKEYLTEDGVLEDVIKKGSELAIDLIEKADEINKEPEEEVEEVESVTEEYVEIVEMPVYSYDYWDPYYDPYYVSQLWLVPALLLF